MAWEVNSQPITLKASSNMSNCQWKFVEALAAGTEGYCGRVTTSLDLPLGVCQNSTADSSGEAIQINTGPIVKVVAGGNISGGDYVMAGSLGSAYKNDSSTGRNIFGVALGYAATGELLTVYKATSFWAPI